MAGFWRDFLIQRTGGGAVGFSLSIANSTGQPLVQVAHGHAVRPDDGAAGAAMTPESRMHIASASKAVTGVALLHAADQAGLGPDATLSGVLATTFPLSPDWSEVTLAELLGHRTGLPGGGYVEYPIRDNVRSVLTEPLPPRGQRPYAYSNVNYTIARLALEAISGETYGDYVSRVFLVPAGINDMVLSPPENQVVAAAYQLSPSAPGEPVRDDFTDGAGPYGWYATATALARFAATGPARLGAPLRGRMVTEELGWIRYRTLGARISGHDGHWSLRSSAGLSSALITLPYGHGAGLLVNTAIGGNLMDMVADGVSASWPLLRCDPRPDFTRWTARIEIPFAADEVRFTLDGSEPSATSRRYDGPFEVALPATVRAVAMRDGGVISPVIRREFAMANYVLPEGSPRLSPTSVS